jgi:hypothetical protein
MLLFTNSTLSCLATEFGLPVLGRQYWEGEVNTGNPGLASVTSLPRTLELRIVLWTTLFKDRIRVVN